MVPVVEATAAASAYWGLEIEKSTVFILLYCTRTSFQERKRLNETNNQRRNVVQAFLTATPYRYSSRILLTLVL